MSTTITASNERIDVLGVGVSQINLDDAVSAIENWIADGSAHYVCITGAHGVMLCRKDQRLRSIHDGAGMVTPDGKPLVWFSRLVGGRHVERVYGPDLMRRMSAVSARRGYRQFYYGGVDGVTEKLERNLVDANPGLQVVGRICPPFRDLTPEEDAALVDRINAANPDIVWVGLGTPKQEYWMARHRAKIRAPVMVGVGAAFDFLSGTKPQAPRFMQIAGLEWLFRLACEPRRLWRRYGYIVPCFSALAITELMRRASLSLLTKASARPLLK